jgi:hypothetical protein
VLRWTDDGSGAAGDHDPPPGPTARRRSGLVLLVAAAAIVLAVVAMVATRPEAEPGDPHASPGTSTSPTPVAPTAPPTTQPAATTPGVDADPAALADLEALAATLTPLGLTSPAEWDRWLPEGKPFPGADTAEDMATCPRLADRLGAALGTTMSYWTGTLPNGPYGCTWATVPLVYDSPDYDYVISVGFLADGTTAASLARGFATAGGPCPWNEPAAVPGAVLVRCSTDTSTEYTLALPDTRLAGGLWTLVVSVKDRAAVPAPQVLPVLVEGVVHAFG